MNELQKIVGRFTNDTLYDVCTTYNIYATLHRALELPFKLEDWLHYLTGHYNHNSNLYPVYTDQALNVWNIYMGELCGSNTPY